MLQNLDYAINKLQWMQTNHIWPNSLRYLWTDAFGLVELISLYKTTKKEQYLNQAEQLIEDVYRVLGRVRGLRIGEASERDGQYFHYLLQWIFALEVYGKETNRPEWHNKAVQLIQQIHDRFLIPGHGVWWKMEEGLDRNHRDGYGLGYLDPFEAYAIYRFVSEHELKREINDMKVIVDKHYEKFVCNQDLGAGIGLWDSHFFPNEEWSKNLYESSLNILDKMWVQVDDTKGYFCRHALGSKNIKYAFTNYGISMGIQSILFKLEGKEKEKWINRVKHLNTFFETYKHNNHYDTDAITHVMGLVSHYPGCFIGHQQIETKQEPSNV